MSVIAFPNLAPQGPDASMSWELRSLTAINRSPLNAVATTLERPGAHWAVRMPYQNLAEGRRARLQTFAASARGHAQRFYVPVYGWTRRGSFPATELLANTAFDGTTSWSVTGQYALAASDGLLRATRTAVSVSHGAPVQSPTLTQYVPYALRALTLAGRGTFSQIGPYFSGITGAATVGAPSYRVATAVLASTGAQTVGVVDLSTSGLLAGDYYQVGFISLSRCALVDNAPNVFDRATEIDNANWTKNNVTVNASFFGAPNGAATAERVVENSSTSSHSIDRSFTKSAAAQDWCIAAAVRAGDASGQRQFACLRLDDGTSSNLAQAFFDLTNGTISTAASAGGTFSNARAFIANLGNGWSYCCVIGRTDTGTTVRARTLMSDNGTNVSYTGDGASNIGLWGVTLTQSSVPVRLSLTTTAAASSGTSQTGGALHLKGLPASTSGLLLQGDPAEIITGSTSQLVRTRAPLNSDAAGVGYFEFEPPLRISPQDGAAVIVHNPMCRMLMESNVNGWTDRLGGFSDIEFAAVEDVMP